jgi:hypothetical protein
MTEQQLDDALEALIDKTDIALVIASLERVCWAKAEHLHSAWQDKLSAKQWERTGKLLGTLHSRIS